MTWIKRYKLKKAIHVHIFSKFQLIQILSLQVAQDNIYVCWHSTIDYCVNMCLVDKILCKKIAQFFIRKLFQPNSCGGNMLFKFLEKFCIGLHMIIELQIEKNQNFLESDVQNYFNQNSIWVQPFTHVYNSYDIREYAFFNKIATYSRSYVSTLAFSPILDFLRFSYLRCSQYFHLICMWY